MTDRSWLARGRRCAGAALAVTFLSFALGSCYINTQRVPGPMEPLQDPLPAGSLELFPEGPEEVLVVRHADPVLVRPAGLTNAVPLPFYRKNARVNSGSWIFSGAGGRVEVLWPGGTSVVLFGKGTGVIGSASRGEPTFLFREVDRASIELTPGDRIELLGGSILVATGGPFVLDHEREEILRVRNRSKGTGRIAFRDAVFDVDPGHVIDLPLLPRGARPFQLDPGFQTLGTGPDVEVRGDLEVLGDPGSPEVAHLRATGDHEVRALGVRVRLGIGDEMILAPIGAEPAPTPAPEPPPSPEPSESPEAVEPGDPDPPQPAPDEAPADGTSGS